jgi:hypothetical protein
MLVWGQPRQGVLKTTSQSIKTGHGWAYLSSQRHRKHN